jgi:hypothetical protein
MDTRRLNRVSTASTPTISFTPVRGGVLQRKCACGGTPGPTGECEGCQKKRLALQREGLGSGPGTRNHSAISPIVHDSVGAPNQSLALASNILMKPRFARDFSGVPAQTEASTEPTRYARFIGEVEDTPTLVPGMVGGSGTGGSPMHVGGGCPSICNRAYADASLNFGGGGVICDGATKCACAFDVPPLRRGQCPGFDAIVVTHETRHLPDVDCNPSGGLHRPPFRDPSQATSSECTHRRESIAEMNAIIPGAAGSCKTGMTSIRDQLNAWVTANCGGGSGSS